MRDLLLRGIETCGQHMAPETLRAYVERNKGDRDGVTGGVTLVESHFYIHTWPLDDGGPYARIEMSTCKPPSDEDAERFRRDVERTFGGKAAMKIESWHEGDRT